MPSDSMDPCRDDPRAACTGAISPRLKRHVGYCHTAIGEISCVYQIRFSFSRQKKLRSRPLLRAGQSPVNRTTKGPTHRAVNKSTQTRQGGKEVQQIRFQAIFSDVVLDTAHQAVQAKCRVKSCPAVRTSRKAQPNTYVTLKAFNENDSP